MPRLIDADKLINEIVRKYGLEHGNAILEIDNAPTVDAVEVVRCKDCWVFHQDETWNPKAGLCGWFDMPVGVNDYCSHGEMDEVKE